MALTLPYPDLDFVPLDVLTADEMNQIVANYTYISNQFPITSENIDFTTFVSEAYPALSGANQQTAAVITNGGKVVHLTGLVTLNAASATFTLASGVPKPAHSIWVPVTAGSSSGATNISGYATISTSGNVTLTMSSAVTYGILSCTYLAAS